MNHGCRKDRTVHVLREQLADINAVAGPNRDGLIQPVTWKRRLKVFKTRQILIQGIQNPSSGTAVQGSAKARMIQRECKRNQHGQG